jgi:hypothetical protein
MKIATVTRILAIGAVVAGVTSGAGGVASAAPVPVSSLDTWALSEDVAQCGVVRIPMTVGLAPGFVGGESYVLFSPEFFTLTALDHRLTTCDIAVTVHWQNLDTGRAGIDVSYPMDSRPDRYQTSNNATYIPTGVGRVRFTLTTATPHIPAPPIEVNISL